MSYGPPALCCIGVDGCRTGWVAVIEREGQEVDAQVFRHWHELIEHFSGPVTIGVDIPIGLPERDSRQCDLAARQFLGKPRSCSVFPAPVRGCLRAGGYPELSKVHKDIDGRGLTRQAYEILDKIRQVDQCLREDLTRQRWIREVHPEVSFTCWNQGRPMYHNKKKADGRADRERLIETVWPNKRPHLAALVCGQGCAPDDLNDALAALWTARRIASGRAQVFPRAAVEIDACGLRMEIVA